MTIITVDELNAYTENYEASDLKTYYIETAQSIIEDYIGYALTADDYTEIIVGKPILLGAMPINSVDSFTIDDEELDSLDYSINRNELIVYDDEVDVALTKTSDIEVTYNAGYSAASSVPSAMKVVALKIASLLLMEEGGNIGVTGVSTPDGLGRTFLNYNNYSKHLKLLKKYRIVRFGTDVQKL